MPPNIATFFYPPYIHTTYNTSWRWAVISKHSSSFSSVCSKHIDSPSYFIYILFCAMPELKANPPFLLPIFPYSRSPPSPLLSTNYSYFQCRYEWMPTSTFWYGFPLYRVCSRPSIFMRWEKTSSPHPKAAAAALKFSVILFRVCIYIPLGRDC